MRMTCVLHGEVWCTCNSVPWEMVKHDKGARIAELRMVAGITLRDMATKLKVTPTYLGEVERGRRYISAIMDLSLREHLPGYGPPVAG